MNRKFCKIISLAVLAILALVIIIMSACNSSGDEARQIRVNSGKIDIPVFDNDENFTDIVSTEGLEDLPYIKNGETVSIEFFGKEPDSISLTEHILSKSGGAKYPTEITGTAIDVEVNNNKASFIIEPNYATMLSSNSHDYDPGATIKGYRLVCDMEGGKSVYSFVIRGDAAILMNAVGN